MEVQLMIFLDLLSNCDSNYYQQLESTMFSRIQPNTSLEDFQRGNEY